MSPAPICQPQPPAQPRVRQTLGEIFRPKRRPRSAASYMRSTFAIDSAPLARATSFSTPKQQQQQQQDQQRRRLLRGRASWRPEAACPEDAKYVLQEDARQGSRSGSFDVGTVPRPRQGFGVRMATAKNKRVVVSSGGGGGRPGRAQPGSARSGR